MTIDKIKFYIGETIFNHWNSIKDISKIRDSRNILSDEINKGLLSDIKYIAELNLLNFLLQETEIKITIFDKGVFKTFESVFFKNEYEIEYFLNELKEYSNNLEMIEYSRKKTLYNIIGEITYKNQLYSFFFENNYKIFVKSFGC